MAAFKIDLFEQFDDNDGNLLAGGFVYIYSAGTSTPTATYADSTGLIAAENPIELDASGRCQTWFLPGSYKAVLKDANGVTLETVDGIFVADPDAASPGSQYVDVVFTYPGGPPVASGWLGGERFTRAVVFPANFAGSFGKIPKALPTAAFAVPIKISGVTVGTATCSVLGVWTFATVGGATVSCVVGDEIDAYGPAVPDTTIADFGITLAGSLA